MIPRLKSKTGGTRLRGRLAGRENDAGESGQDDDAQRASSEFRLRGLHGEEFLYRLHWQEQALHGLGKGHKAERGIEAMCMVILRIDDHGGGSNPAAHRQGPLQRVDQQDFAYPTPLERQVACKPPDQGGSDDGVAGQLQLLDQAGREVIHANVVRRKSVVARDAIILRNKHVRDGGASSCVLAGLLSEVAVERLDTA